MEHIVHSHIISHFERHNILHSAQHGFRKRRSCESQLILTVHDLALGLNDSHQIDAVLLDFSKAFDKVPHTHLLHKLHHYGVRNQTLDWVAAFLRNRTQRVVCEGQTSRSVPVVSGVPQGTVLGPLLFLAYINDLPDVVSSTARLFADDCLLYRTISSHQDAECLQKDLDSLQKWETQWGMQFNPEKCEVVRITLKRRPVISNYFIHNSALKTVGHAKYLGVTLDSKLSFNAHIDTICKKANSTRAFIMRNTKGCPRSLRSKAYSTFVRPTLEYASAAWDPHTIQNIKKIQSVQRLAARGVMDDWSRGCSAQPTHTSGSPTTMQQLLGWEPLDERRAKTKATMMYKLAHDLIDIPTHLLIPNTRPTRGHLCKYQVLSTRVKAYQYSFFPSAIILWNGLPEHLVSSPSLESFKHHLRGVSLLAAPHF